MTQLCPNCKRDNRDTGQYCAYCQAKLAGLLGSHTLLQNRYEVIDVLGCGGMGAVYLALDRNLDGSRVAVKENLDISAESQAQFRREAVVLANLDHPNLPKVSNHFIEPSGRQYLVMEFIEGDDLQDVIEKDGAIPETQVMVWVDALLDALAYLHSRPRPIFHRDIKPANIKLTSTGKIKLVDFGLVKIFDADHPSTSLSLRGVGTPEYAPMEQYSGTQHTDQRTDIYALGATLYNLLTGQAPVAAAIRTAKPSMLMTPRQLNPAITRTTEAAVIKAIELPMDKRFQSAEEMRLALKHKTARWLWLAIGVAAVIFLSAVFMLAGSITGQGPFGVLFWTPTPAATPTSTPTALPSATATATATATIALTWTPTATDAPTSTPSAMPTFTSTRRPTIRPSPLPTPTATYPPCPKNYFWDPIMGRCKSTGGGGSGGGIPTVYP